MSFKGPSVWRVGDNSSGVFSGSFLCVCLSVIISLSLSFFYRDTSHWVKTHLSDFILPELPLYRLCLQVGSHPEVHGKERVRPSTCEFCGQKPCYGHKCKLSES